MPDKINGWEVHYKCRACGETEKHFSIPDAMLSEVQMEVIGLPFAPMPTGIKPTQWHHCHDYQWGLADLVSLVAIKE